MSPLSFEGFLKIKLGFSKFEMAQMWFNWKTGGESSVLPNRLRCARYLRQGVLKLVTVDPFSGMILPCGAALYIVGCLVASLAFTHFASSTSPLKNIFRHCQIYSRQQNSPQLGTTVLVE